jgi:serine/threonine protein kinase
LKILNSKFEDHNALCKKEGRFEDIKSKGLGHRKVRFYFIDMVKALFYCHHVIKVIHKDIKPDNIVING